MEKPGIKIILLTAFFTLVINSVWCRDQGYRGCTVFTVSKGDAVFFAGNDDYTNIDSVYWARPGNGERYGALYFGEPDNVQQGFNEKGLAYDANGLPHSAVTSHPGKLPVPRDYNQYHLVILQECAAVEEVIEWVRSHEWHPEMNDQMHFADPSGDAVVISAGPDGKAAFTRKEKGDSFLVSTNFNVADPANGSYPCWRYEETCRVLKGYLQAGGPVSIKDVAAAAENAHVENPGCWTLYTVAADLVKRDVFIYFMFQYDDPVVLNIDSEIARAPEPASLRSLFPASVLTKADSAFEKIANQSRNFSLFGYIWIGIVCICLGALFLTVKPAEADRRNRLFVTAVLGPFGLGSPSSSAVQARCDFAAVIPGLFVSVWAAIFMPVVNQNGLLQIGFFLAVPFFVRLIFFNKLIYCGRAADTWRELFITSNFAVAGAIPLVFPIIIWSIRRFGIQPRVVPVLWGLTIFGSVCGILLLFLYYRFGGKNLFRKKWPMPLVSTAFLIAGLFLTGITTGMVH